MPDAEVRVAEAIRRFAASKEVPEKYHHTMTIAWVRLAARLLDPAALDRHYSVELLSSDEARAGWVEPDRDPL